MFHACDHTQSMYTGSKLNRPSVPGPAVIAAAGRHQQPLRSLRVPVHVREEERMSFVPTQPEHLVRLPNARQLRGAPTYEGLGR
jgi:hypothetical protein